MSGRTPGPGGVDDVGGVLVGAVAGTVLVGSGALWLPLTIAQPAGYHGQNLIASAIDLAAGRIEWDTLCTVVAAGEVTVLGGLTAGVVVLIQRRRRRRTRVDHAAKAMARRDELAHLSPHGVAESARRLRPTTLADVADVAPDDAGVLICHTLVGDMPLRQSWEDMAVDIWGPRTGKTTSRAIPAIVAAPGPTVVTSVKGDIVDATRGLREQRGPVVVFDPQQVWGRPQGMWWNPLRYVTTVTAARQMAEHFAAAEREPGMQRDAFFDPEAEELVANLLLAAACANRTLVDVYRWATSPTNEEPAVLLDTARHWLASDAVKAVINLPDKTRGGIYGGAKKMLSCLTEPAVTAWVTPPPEDSEVVEFDPAGFVAPTDGRPGTLYLLSKGGPGSPAPLIAALTDTVLRAGEEKARQSPGRRLDPPLLSVLDEAANICRIRQLPSLYSFYGSHGLPIITILQSYAQGIDVWGREGMRKLWSAANVRTYGGGVADPDFLEELSRLIGEHDVITRSTSHTGTGWGQRSVSRSPRKERILDVAALGAMPRGRMVVFSSGARPALAKTCPWQAGPYAEQIRASLARFDPGGQVPTELPPAAPDGAGADAEAGRGE